MKLLTHDQLAHLADTLIDAIHQPALKRYCEEIYGDDAYSAQVQVHRLANGSLLSLRVLVWDRDGQYLYPDIHLRYWLNVARESYIFEECDTLAQETMAAESYLLMCQVPQEYGIAAVQTEEIVLHEIKCLDDIHLYIEDDLPETILHLKNVEEKEAQLIRS